MSLTLSGPSAPSGLSRYERARLLGVRALQISGGARVSIATTQTDSLAIAREELAQNAIAFSITTNSLRGTTVTRHGPDSVQRTRGIRTQSNTPVDCPFLE